VVNAFFENVAGELDEYVRDDVFTEFDQELLGVEKLLFSKHQEVGCLAQKLTGPKQLKHLIKVL